MRTPRNISCVLAVLGAVMASQGWGLGGARAERLDKEACEALRAEEGGLVAAGVKSDMEKGPDWAKANLAPERLQQVGRLIEIGEQIAFRCRTVADPGKRRKGKSQDAGKANDTNASALEEVTGPIETGKPAKSPKPAKPDAIKVKPAKPAASAAADPATKPAKRNVPAAAKVKKSAPPKQTGLFNFD